MEGAAVGDEHEHVASRQPTFREAVLFWLKLGFINFGGPAGQIAIMHREIVERRRWLSEERFMHALNYCMLLPGPEAQQLATYVGWLLHRTTGGLVAGGLFVLPGLVVLLALSAAYVTFGSSPLAVDVLTGLKAVVLAIIVHALIRIGRKALQSWSMVAVAAAAFVAIALLRVPFPLIVAGAAAIGFVGHRVGAPGFSPRPLTTAAEAPAPTARRGGAAPGMARYLRRVALVGAALWAVPLALLAAAGSRAATLLDVGLFFSKVAVVTFGGAYAVLAYITDVGVATGWLAPGQMLDGLGLAETTPGPLIMVVTFVGFLAGHGAGGALDPLVAGVLGGLVATYFTFLPSFLFIFLGAPYVELLRGKPSLSAALRAITAAVVGVILNLAVFFASNVLVADGAVEWFPLALGAAAFAALALLDASVVLIVLAGAAAGLAFGRLA